MATSFRTDVGDGLLAILNAFIAANPTLLVRAYRARPSGPIADLPMAYIEGRPERVTHVQGVRTRTMTPSVVVIDRNTDNAETMARLDVLVDALLDAFTAEPHVTPATIWDEMTIADEPFDVGETEFAAVRFTFGDLSIAEGRS